VFKDKVTELSERIQQLKSNVSNNQSAAAPSDSAAASKKFPDMSAVTSTMASMLQEEREKDKRKLNLIIHGIPESTSEIPVEKKEHDTKLVATMFNQHLKIETSIEDIVRLGKKDSTKQRLLKISIPSLAVKKSILHNSSKLRDVPDPDWMKKVVVTPDLTLKEQKQSKELRKQLANLNSSGKKYWIRNGAILRRESP